MVKLSNIIVNVTVDFKLIKQEQKVMDLTNYTESTMSLFDT